MSAIEYARNEERNISIIKGHLKGKLFIRIYGGKKVLSATHTDDKAGAD